MMWSPLMILDDIRWFPEIGLPPVIPLSEKILVYPYGIDESRRKKHEKTIQLTSTGAHLLVGG